MLSENLLSGLIEAIPPNMAEKNPCPTSIFEGLSYVCDHKLAGKCDKSTLFGALGGFVFNKAKPIWENDPIEAFGQNTLLHKKKPQQYIES